MASEQSRDLQAQLRRLGVVKGTRNLSPAPPVTPPRPMPATQREPVSLEALLPGGRLESTAAGSCFVLEKVYPLQHKHGLERLAAFLNFSGTTAAPLAQDHRFGALALRDALFIDTETTGLAGAGTLAFMVGTAYFAADALIVRQYFLRDHGDETAMLLLLTELMESKSSLVTFNGRSFDIPLLDNRFLMNRLSSNIADLPHLDLLHPSRRLWRRRLGSCALSALEPPLLGVRRSQEDVPGWLIPGMYNQYVRSGDAQEMTRVFYHNQIDMLSMVTLGAQVLRLFNQPLETDHPVDLFSLGKWQAEMGLTTQAESLLRQAAGGDLPLELFHETLLTLGLLLKRLERHAEAVPYWQQVAATSFDHVMAHVELAKYYEWHARELEQALHWTEQALALAGSWRNRHRTDLIAAELNHRQTRLQRKIAQKNKSNEQ